MPWVRAKGEGTVGRQMHCGSRGTEAGHSGRKQLHRNSEKKIRLGKEKRGRPPHKKSIYLAIRRWGLDLLIWWGLLHQHSLCERHCAGPWGYRCTPLSLRMYSGKWRCWVTHCHLHIHYKVCPRFCNPALLLLQLKLTEVMKDLPPQRVLTTDSYRNPQALVILLMSLHSQPSWRSPSLLCILCPLGEVCQPQVTTKRALTTQPNPFSALGWFFRLRTCFACSPSSGARRRAPVK